MANLPTKDDITIIHNNSKIHELTLVRFNDSGNETYKLRQPKEGGVMSLSKITTLLVLTFVFFTTQASANSKIIHRFESKGMKYAITQDVSEKRYTLIKAPEFRKAICRMAMRKIDAKHRKRPFQSKIGQMFIDCIIAKTSINKLVWIEKLGKPVRKAILKSM